MYWVLVLVWGVVWGLVVNKIIYNKGYDENWFWWGFFFGFIALIVALTKPDARSTYSTPAATAASQNYDKKMLESGGWRCSCGKVNPAYFTKCAACGKTKKEVQEKEKEDKELENLKKVKEYKDLLDSGVITEEEFSAKKKEILG